MEKKVKLEKKTWRRQRRPNGVYAVLSKYMLRFILQSNDNVYLCIRRTPVRPLAAHCIVIWPSAT